MSIFKIITHTTEDRLVLLERINYIFDPLATMPCLLSGRNVSLRYPFEEMMLVKKSFQSAWNNTLQGKHFFEFVVSLMECESRRQGDFTLCMDKIVGWLSDSMGGHFQTISAIHINTDNLHAHIIMNNIDFRTGERLDLTLSVFHTIRQAISDILERDRFSSIYMGGMADD